MSLTPRQIANKANAQKSTGPKSLEGKGKSSMNAMKHGLAAKQAILPNENSQAFEELKQDWIDALQPTDAAENALTERAALADWRLKRCVRAETARLAIRVRNAAEEFNFKRFQRAEELGRKLVYDPISRTKVPDLDPETTRKLNEWRKINPVLIVRELEGFSEGVQWLIGRWERLLGLLSREAFWHYPEKFEAIKLLGMRPEDTLNHHDVGAIVLACWVIHPQPWAFLDDVQQGMLGVDGVPVYGVRTELLLKRAPKSKKEAYDFLWDNVEEEIDRLNQLKAQLDFKTELNRRDAEEAAMFDDSKEGVLALRYESARDRELHRALADLQKKRKDDEKRAKEPVEEIEIEPEVVIEEDVATNVTTRRTAPPNEPNLDREKGSPTLKAAPNEGRKDEKASPERRN